MKKILFPFLFVLFSLTSYGQEFSVGPKIGVSQSNITLSNEDFISGDDSFGYHVGLFVRMGGNSIFVQPEFLYTNTGGTIIQKQANSTNIIIDASFDRVDIPFMLGFKLAQFFRIQAGPIASILIDHTIVDSNQNPLNVDYNNATFGYQAGLGFDLGNFILDFKYENSLGKISNSTNDFATDQRLNQLIFSAGFRLF